MTSRKRSRGNGEGSLRKRDNGQWEGRYTLGRTAEGKQVRRSVYGRTRAEAAEKLKRALALDAPLNASTPITLTDYMRRVAEQRVGHVSERTSEIDQDWIRYVSAHPTGQQLVQKLRVGHLEDLYRTLAETRSRSVVLHVRTFVNLTLRHAVRHEVILAHPGIAAEVPRMEQPVVAQAITAEQVTRLLTTAKEGNGRWYAPLYFAVSLGLRHGELLGLQWGDIDEAAGELHIRRAMSSGVGGAPRLTAPKTRHSARTLYLAPTHLALVAELRADQASAGLSTPWVFCAEAGQPLRQDNVRRAFHAILKRAGLPRLRIHDLRHTFATHLIGAGHDVKTVSSLMGHGDTRITLDIYTHAQEGLKKRAALAAAKIAEPESA